MQGVRCAGTHTRAQENVVGGQDMQEDHVVLQSLVCGVPDVGTTDLCVGASSSSLRAAPPTPWLEDSGSVSEVALVSAEGEPSVASASGMESGEGSVSMSEETSSLMAMGRRLAVAGTSSALPVPSGVSSSFEGAESEAARAPGEAVSLELGERLRGRGSNSERRRMRFDSEDAVRQYQHSCPSQRGWWGTCEGYRKRSLYVSQAVCVGSAQSCNRPLRRCVVLLLAQRSSPHSLRGGDRRPRLDHGRRFG